MCSGLRALLKLLPVEPHVGMTHIPLQVIKSPPVPGFDKVLTELPGEPKDCLIAMVMVLQQACSM